MSAEDEVGKASTSAMTNDQGQDSTSSASSSRFKEEDAISTNRQRKHTTINTSDSESSPDPLSPPPSHSGILGDKPKGRHRKQWPRIPWFRRPLKNRDGPWLEHHHRAGQWLNLFYDLAVAAILSSLGNKHDITNPSKIPDYLGYFVIIQWMWATQTYYDIRFQAEDVIHRIYKFLQICLYIYIGAASGNWNFAKLRSPTSFATIEYDEYEDRLMAFDSYQTVVIAFTLSRVLLAIQYLVSAVMGRLARRKVSFQISTAIVLIISIGFSIVSIAIPANSTTQIAVKILFLYLSILIEFIIVVLQLHPRFSHYISVAEIAERYGAITLIILGETGFNTLTVAFNKAISGVSENSRATYAQVVLAIGIMVLLYLFLFSWFVPEEEVSEKRALVWQSIHLPLHLGIVLLLAAMVNVVVTISFAHGLDKVGTAYNTVLGSIANGTDLSDSQYRLADRYLSKLKLQPDWDTEQQYFRSVVNSTNPSTNVDIEMLQYLGQIVSLTTRSYGVEINEKATDALYELGILNATYTTDTTLHEERTEEAINYLRLALSEPISESLSGALWLFPTAGTVLILASVRSFLWYRLAGIDHYLIHGGMIILGIILGLLGLLDLGRQYVTIDVEGPDTISQDVSPMYELVVNSEVPLVVVILVYALAYFGAALAAAWFRRKRARKQQAYPMVEINSEHK